MFRDNNYNGFITHIRDAGTVGLDISGGQFEGSSSTPIVFTNVTFKTDTSVGASIAVRLGGGAIIVPAAGQSCISITSLKDIVYDGVYFGNTTAVKVASNANCNTCIALRIWNAGGGNTFSGLATRHFELDASIDGMGSAILRGNFQAILSKQLSLSRMAPTYGTTVNIDASAGNLFDISATDGVPFTIAAPTNPTDGQRITITIQNTSGGALGAVTWNAVFKMAAWTSPATANSRSIDFKYNGTNWVEVCRTTVDVPN